MSKLPCQLRDLLERVAMHHPNDIGKIGSANVLHRFPGALRVVFDGYDAATGLASAEAEPDRAVTARGADFQN